MSESTITVSEVNRAVTRIENSIGALTEKIDDLPNTRDMAYLENRIKDLEDWQKWAMRLGVPGLGAAIVSLAGLLTGAK